MVVLRAYLSIDQLLGFLSAIDKPEIQWRREEKQPGKSELWSKTSAHGVREAVGKGPLFFLVYFSTGKRGNLTLRRAVICLCQPL